jgi:hypothetical protein
MLTASPDSRAASGDFIGSKKCGSCHPAQLRAWKNGPHARAGKSLAGSSSSACLACHTTGSAPVGRVVERAVGCESCHGPGRGYSPADVMRDPPLRKALGLVSLAAGRERDEVCKSCHRHGTKLSPLNLRDGWKRIGHGAGMEIR